MSSPESVMAQMQKLLDDSNTKTGHQDETLTVAVNRLIAGYGNHTVCPHTNTYQTNFVLSSEFPASHYYDLVCSDCGAVVDTKILDMHTDDDGDCKCDLCGAEVHDYLLQYVNIGNGTHKRTATCTKCGHSYDAIEGEECYDRNNDGKCDACDADMVTECEHRDTYAAGWTAKGDGTHITGYRCRDCGETVSLVTEPCADPNGDGKCDYCGADIENVCAHTSVEETWTPNGNETHVTKVVCRNCGEIVSEVTERCRDTNGDEKCDVCGGDVVCKHSITHTNRTNNGNGTHTETTTCQNCGKIISQTTVACTDENGDSKCDYCGVEIPADDTKKSYAKGELNGINGYKFSATDNVLVCKKPNGGFQGVAVAKLGGTSSSQQTSGQKVLPIPIPKSATKVTFTAGNNFATELEALFIKGQPNAVVKCDTQTTEQGEFYSDQKATLTFTAGEYNYLVMNVRSGTISAIPSQQIATSGELVFE